MSNLVIKKEDYFYAVRRPYPPLYSYLIEHGWSQYEHYEEFALSEPWAVRRAVMTPDFRWYFSKAAAARGAELILNTWAEPKKFQLAVRVLRQRERALVTAVKENFPTFAAAYEHYMPAVSLVFVPDKLLAERLSALLRQQLSVEEADSLMGQLNVPLEDNLYKQEELDLVMTEDLGAHVKKYEWLNSRYGADVPYTIEEAAARKAELNGEEIRRRRTEEKNRVREAVERAKKLLGERATLVDVMQFLVFYRTHRTDIINQVAYLYIPRLKDIARKRGLTYEQLLHCLPPEITGKLLPLSVIHERMREHAFIMEEGDVQCVIGEEAAAIREMFREDHEAVSQITGTAACRGVVRGTVRLVAGPGDYGRVQDGDILVTSMTTPNMVPIMKKAAAFVTDEGGITCHAAIMSREMNKPCIIGTGKATSLLHDGDEVEVDATQGIVRILK